MVEKSKELEQEVEKIVSENLKDMVATTLPLILSGKAVREGDLINPGIAGAHEQSYKEGGGHNDRYHDSYNEDTYHDHYSDSRKDLGRPDIDPVEFNKNFEITKAALKKNAELVSKDIASKIVTIKGFQNR